MGLLNSLASLHRVFGFVTGGLSVVTLVFALLAKPRMLVRLSSIVGLGVVGLAVIGGILYVTSVFKDRWSLGQMADAFVGVFAVYFVQLLLMTISSRTQRAGRRWAARIVTIVLARARQPVPDRYALLNPTRSRCDPVSLVFLRIDAASCPS